MRNDGYGYNSTINTHDPMRGLFQIITFRMYLQNKITLF